MCVCYIAQDDSDGLSTYPYPYTIPLCSDMATLFGLDDWLTVHRSITLVDLQLDAQYSYLFTYNTFIKILYMFRALTCSPSGGLHRNYICSLWYRRSPQVTVLCTGAQHSHLQRETIPEATYIQLRRRPPEGEQVNARNM